MKKIFTLIAFVCFSVANALAAYEVTPVTLDDAVTNGTVINICVGEKYLYGKDAQNCAMGTKDEVMKPTIAVRGYKVEKVGETYLFRCITPAGDNYSLWGSNPCYLNGQKSSTGATFNLGKNQDLTDGSSWTLEADGSLKNVGNSGYFNGTSTTNTPVTVSFVEITGAPDADPIVIPASLKSFIDNKTVVYLKSGDKILYGPDQQNIAIGTWTQASATTNNANAYIIEADEYYFYLRAVKADGSNISAWGANPCWINTNGGDIVFEMAKDQDVFNGSSWTISETPEGKYKIYNVASKAYLAANGTSATVKAEGDLWEFVSLPSAALYPVNTVNTLNTGAGMSWAGITFPCSISNGSFWGSHDADIKNYVDISDVDAITIELESGNDKFRAFVWNEETNSRDILFFYPEDAVSPNYKVDYTTTGKGKYVVDVRGYSKLMGIKPYGGGGKVVTAYVTKEGYNNVAVDEARTFSYACPLDFSEVTDVEAYIATAVADGKVTMKKVEGIVPANTGLVLKQVNDKTVITIPASMESTEDVSGNLLVATTAVTTVESGYVLAGTGAQLGWYSVGSVKPTLAAGKAYLSASVAGKKMLEFVWGDDNTTAADTVAEAKVVADKAFYTVAGVKVAQPKKGNLYIYNGKAIVF